MNAKAHPAVAAKQIPNRHIARIAEIATTIYINEAVAAKTAAKNAQMEEDTGQQTHANRAAGAVPDLPPRPAEGSSRVHPGRHGKLQHAPTLPFARTGRERGHTACALGCPAATG